LFHNLLSVRQSQLPSRLLDAIYLFTNLDCRNLLMHILLSGQPTVIKLFIEISQLPSRLLDVYRQTVPKLSIDRSQLTSRLLDAIYLFTKLDYCNLLRSNLLSGQPTVTKLFIERSQLPSRLLDVYRQTVTKLLIERSQLPSRLFDV
jgi:hypothetical protein